MKKIVQTCSCYDLKVLLNMKRILIGHNGKILTNDGYDVTDYNNCQFCGKPLKIEEGVA